jgi:hypothetical protein
MRIGGGLSWGGDCDQMSQEGVLLLSGLDSRLAKDLPSDLQRLRCKVKLIDLKFSSAGVS